MKLIETLAVVMALTLGGGADASATVGASQVTRISLLGYEVGGQVWEAQDAARVIAWSEGVRAEGAALVEATRAPHADLLRGPVQAWGQGAYHETWRVGPAASRRGAALRRALCSVSQSSTRSSGSVTYSYYLEQDVTVPQIERVATPVAFDDISLLAGARADERVMSLEERCDYCNVVSCSCSGGERDEQEDLEYEETEYDERPVSGALEERCEFCGMVHSLCSCGGAAEYEESEYEGMTRFPAGTSRYEDE